MTAFTLTPSRAQDRRPAVDRLADHIRRRALSLPARKLARRFGFAPSTAATIAELVYTGDGR